MSVPRLSALVLAAALLAPAAPAFAQQGVTELGFDMALAYETESEIFSIALPAGAGLFSSIALPPAGFRAGFFLGDAISLEPTLNFGLFTGNGETASFLNTSVKFLYHFTTDPAQSRFFFAAGPSFTLVDFDDDAQSQFGLLGEFGVKLPIASRVGARLAAGFMHGFEKGDVFSGDYFPDRNVIYVTAGLSLFLGGN